MSAICFAKFPSTDVFFVALSPIPSKSPRTLSLDASFPRKFCGFTRKFRTLSYSKSSEVEELSSPDDEWLKKLPEKKKPLYSHSLPCIEAWFRSLGFYQSKDDRAVWYARIQIGWFNSRSTLPIYTSGLILCFFFIIFRLSQKYLLFHMFHYSSNKVCEILLT